ncbi:MAG: TrmH family RNA methyltransferase [Treponema sp.]
MIELFKLTALPHTQKIRKIIKIMEILEHEAVRETSELCSFSCDSFYIHGLLQHILVLYPDDAAIRCAVRLFEESDPVPYRRIFNTVRHALYKQSNTLPSEWDLIAPGRQYGTKMQHTVFALRPFFPNVIVYAEDIRAPFNLGSIFRTAEAFGAEKLLLSEGCVPPEHPRAARSAMGCVEYLPWDYCPLDTLPAGLPVFALETGGTDISKFNFPQKGVVLLGSEELGLSTAALNKVTAGIVSIPMKGIKASLNVGVAFGILMQYWTAYLAQL